MLFAAADPSALARLPGSQPRGPRCHGRSPFTSLATFSSPAPATSRTWASRRASATAGGKRRRPPCLRTAPHLPTWTISRLSPLLHTPERRPSGLGARRGPRIPPQAAPRWRECPTFCHQVLLGQCAAARRDQRRVLRAHLRARDAEGESEIGLPRPRADPLISPDLAWPPLCR